MRKAILENGVVVNIIEVEDGKHDQFEGVLLEDVEECDMGWEVNAAAKVRPKVIVAKG